jgi:hypothetical protein
MTLSAKVRLNGKRPDPSSCLNAPVIWATREKPESTSLETGTFSYLIQVPIIAMLNNLQNRLLPDPRIPAWDLRLAERAHPLLAQDPSERDPV